MKKIWLVLILILLLTACTAAPESATPPPSTSIPPTETPLLPTPTPEAVLLELSGPSGSRSLTLADLKALPKSEGQAGFKSSTGKITVPTTYTGVAITDLAGLVGGLDPSLGVNVIAKDGYAMTISYDQIANSDFITYDPATGDEKQMTDPLTAIVAYERDGQQIPADSEGPLRLVIISPKNNQVTDGHWSVKWVTQLELKPLGEEWKLMVNGGINKEIDRNSFQSCSAPGCHQATWTDESAQKWTGVPLWLLLGSGDDEISHDGPAFNDLLAQLGYPVEIVASDGFSVTLDSPSVRRNDDWIVADKVNDNPLPDKYFPLRLVGKGLEKGQMVGSIKEINLKIDPAKATQVAEMGGAAPTSAPQETAPSAPLPQADLVIFGMVDNILGLNEADLRAMEVEDITAEHPKKGQQNYLGIRLNDLLEQAIIKPGAAKLVFTASDGYAIEADLSQVLACKDCLIAFSETPGKFNLVMPGFESGLWVKEIAQIEVK